MGDKMYDSLEEARAANHPCKVCGKKRFVPLAHLLEGGTKYTLAKPAPFVAHIFCPGEHEE